MAGRELGGDDLAADGGAEGDVFGDGDAGGVEGGGREVAVGGGAAVGVGGEGVYVVEGLLG